MRDIGQMKTILALVLNPKNPMANKILDAVAIALAISLIES